MTAARRAGTRDADARRAGARGAAIVVASALTLLIALPATASTTHSSRATEPRCQVELTYRIFLSRDPTSDESRVWSAYLASGGSRATLPNQLARSDEWLGVAIARIYQQALDRTPDPAGLAYWADQVRSGVPLSRIAVTVYGSNEFYTRAGGTDSAYVADLYQRIFSRPADSAGIAFWTGQLRTRPRSYVASVFYGSSESRGDRVDALYDQLLGRAPDAAGRQYWIGQLATVDDVKLAINLASSAEFSRRAQTLCTPIPLLRITNGNAASANPALSDDATTLVFESEASNLVPGDNNGQSDIFLRNLVSGSTTRLTNGNAGSRDAAVSADGSTVVFGSDASNLVPGDNNTEADIFLWNRTTGATTRITQGHTSSLRPSVSDDGRFVTYWSNVGGDLDVYLWDRTTGGTTRVTNSNGSSAMDPAISGDGSTIVFESNATNLVPGDDNARIDIFSWDRATKAITRLTDGDSDSIHATVSDDGSLVAFSSWATDLVPGDTDERSDVFLWSRSGATTTMVSDGTGEFGYSPSISGNGDMIAFDSVPVPDGDEGDVLLWDGATGDMTTLAEGNGPSHAASASETGGVVAFASHASDLVAGDLNGVADIFLWQH